MDKLFVKGNKDGVLVRLGRGGVRRLGVFEWGFHKGGPLALALMRAAFSGRDDGEEWARVYAPWFQQDVLARLDKDAQEVEFTVDMDRWVYDRTAKGAIKITKGATS